MATTAAAPKFINDAAAVPSEAIEGLLLTRPDLTVVPGAPNVVVRRDIPRGQVAIICGGGSGHEPAHGGFVADGWLTAAVCGGVFASPSHASVLAAIRHVSAANGNAGVLVLIKNYGGDVINFTYAATVASVDSSVATFVIGDDVAFGADHDAQRGVAGTVLLYKMLGAAAREGASLEKLVHIASSLRPAIRSLGASLSSCAVPGMPATGQLPPATYELGLGIHGEAGKERLPLEGCDNIVRRILDHIGQPPPINATASKTLLPDAEAPAVWWTAAGDAPAVVNRVVLFVNNLGATTDIEMQIVVRAAVTDLQRRGVAVERIVSTRSMTALDMHGISITLLALDASHLERTVALLDAPNPAAVAFPVTRVPTNASSAAAGITTDITARLLARAANPTQVESQTTELIKIIRSVCVALLPQEAELNAFDAVVGDGDIGTGAARACAATLALLDAVDRHSAATGTTPRMSTLLAAVGETVADSFAGTSGPLLGAFLAAAATAVASSPESVISTVCVSLRAGTDAVRAVGAAAPGDRTMVDVLEPLAAASFDPNAALVAAFEQLRSISRASADAAKSLSARKGRARYSNGRELGQAEPGCELIHRILAAVCIALRA